MGIKREFSYLDKSPKILGSIFTMRFVISSITINIIIGAKSIPLNEEGIKRLTLS
jgi:hypothetical protein